MTLHTASKDPSQFIVTTAEGCWGKGTTLKEACRNARLLEYVRGDIYADLLEYYLTVENGDVDWRDVHRDCEALTDDDFEPVEIFIYWWDSDGWEDFQICDLTGSVTFLGFKYDQEQAQAAFDQSCIAATWHNGKITARQTNARAA